MNAVDFERIKNLGKMVGSVARTVEIRCIAKLPAALSDGIDVVPLVGLKRLTQDGARLPGSPVVDDQQLVRVEKRFV
jgi:hypothetical protein